MSTFAFVHGAWHGAWCFDTVRALLAEAGHESVAPDLPITDPEAGCPEYAGVVAAALGGPEDIVVVGHSAGGLTAPLVPERRHATQLVMLTPLVPDPGRAPLDDFADDPAPLTELGRQGRENDEQGRSFWRDAGAAIEVMYNECDEATAVDAAGRLLPQGQRTMTDPSTLTGWPPVDTTYVICTGDRMMSEQWARTIGVPRANCRLVEMPGDHSPMLSRPRELAELLDGLTR